MQPYNRQTDLRGISTAAPARSALCEKASELQAVKTSLKQAQAEVSNGPQASAQSN